MNAVARKIILFTTTFQTQNLFFGCTRRHNLQRNGPTRQLRSKYGESQLDSVIKSYYRHSKTSRYQEKIQKQEPIETLKNCRDELFLSFSFNTIDNGIYYRGNTSQTLGVDILRQFEIVKIFTRIQVH